MNDWNCLILELNSIIDLFSIIYCYWFYKKNKYLCQGKPCWPSPAFDWCWLTYLAQHKSQHTNMFTHFFAVNNRLFSLLIWLTASVIVRLQLIQFSNLSTGEKHTTQGIERRENSWSHVVFESILGMPSILRGISRRSDCIFHSFLSSRAVINFCHSNFWASSASTGVHPGIFITSRWQLARGTPCSPSHLPSPVASRTPHSQGS